jgi:hypothetical protein
MTELCHAEEGDDAFFGEFRTTGVQASILTQLNEVRSPVWETARGIPWRNGHGLRLTSTTGWDRSSLDTSVASNADCCVHSIPINPACLASQESIPCERSSENDLHVLINRIVRASIDHRIIWRMASQMVMDMGQEQQGLTQLFHEQ